MIKGTLGDCDLQIILVDNLKDEEHDDLEGRARKRQKVQLVEAEIDSGLDGRAMVNTVLHEFLHLVECVHGWKARHEEVWLLASSLSQALITTGLIDPTAFEARIRTLNAKIEAPEEAKEPNEAL